MTDKEFAWQLTLEWANMIMGYHSPMNTLRRNNKRLLRLAWVGVFLFLWSLGGCAPQNEVVNYRTYTDPEKGIFYIYDGVLDRAELISGVGTEQTRVIITRQGR